MNEIETSTDEKVKQIRLFTPLWGHEHNAWFRHATFPSLNSALNKSALIGANWTIWGAPELATLKELQTFPCNVHVVADPVNAEAGEIPAGLLRGLQYTMEQCLTENSQLLMALPDYIFSYGAVTTLRQIGKQYNSLIAALGIRVLPSFLEDWSTTPLLECAFKHLHPSWQHAKLSKSTNSAISGVSWQHVTPQLIAVRHRLPPILLANLIPADLKYFQTNSFDAWDHRWPSHDNNWHRQITVTNSDAAYFLELTHRMFNNCATAGTDPIDVFKNTHKRLPHHYVNATKTIFLNLGSGQKEMGQPHVSGLPHKDKV